MKKEEFYVKDLKIFSQELQLMIDQSMLQGKKTTLKGFLEKHFWSSKQRRKCAASEDEVREVIFRSAEVLNNPLGQKIIEEEECLLIDPKAFKKSVRRCGLSYIKILMAIKNLNGIISGQDKRHTRVTRFNHGNQRLLCFKKSFLTSYGYKF